MFNFTKIVDEFKPDLKKLAPVLYPNVQYPSMALNRVLKGEALLNTNQLEALAQFLGVLPHELFRERGWASASTEDNIVFSKNGYDVYLHRNGCLISVRKSDGYSEQYVATQKVVTLSEFIEYIDNLIFPKKEDDGNNENLD